MKKNKTPSELNYTKSKDESQVLREMARFEVKVVFQSVFEQE
jgi:hypothetical protein